MENDGLEGYEDYWVIVFTPDGYKLMTEAEWKQSGIEKAKVHYGFWCKSEAEEYYAKLTSKETPADWLRARIGGTQSLINLARQAGDLVAAIQMEGYKKDLEGKLAAIEKQQTSSQVILDN